MPQPSSDPQLLSHVLRAKLGIASFDPQWDAWQPRRPNPFSDQNVLMPQGQPAAPIPNVNESAMLRQRMQAPDMDRRLPLMAGPTM